MKIPKLSEVFVIHEVNVTSLSQINKIPLDIASRLNSYDSKNADVLAKILVNRYRQNIPPEMLGMPDVKGSTKSIIWNGYTSQFMSVAGDLIVKYLSKKPKDKDLILKMSDDWRKLLKFLKDKNEEIEKYDLSDRADMTFPDGSYWVKIKDKECDEEGESMQHCGAAVGDMWSLRDKNSKSHVTADIFWDPMRRRGAINQIMGKQNTSPNKKYWSSIESFVLKHNFVLYQGFKSDNKEFGKFMHSITNTDKKED